MVVLRDGIGDNGEIQSRTISVREGATLDVSDFGTYSLQVGQSLAGGGTVNATGGAISAFDDNSFTPGDSVGTLSIDGDVSLAAVGGGGTLNYELGNSPGAIGGTENDLIAISGTLSTIGNPALALNVTPVEAAFGTGSYRLISHSGGTTAVGAITPEAVNAAGDLLNIRQILTINGSNPGQVNLVVSGIAESRTWNGTSGNNTWDVDTSSNWSEGDQRFRDLDNVTFNNAASERNVAITTNVHPGSTTFSHTSGSYTLSGAGGIRGAGPVNVNSATANLHNTGNDYSGTTTVASGATLNIASASTGAIVNNGTLSVGGTGQAGPNFVTNGLQLNYDAAQDAAGDGSWRDASPAGGVVNLNFGGDDSTKVAASDTTFQYLTSAYSIPTSGAAISSGANNGFFDDGGPRSQQAATFEVVFNVSNTAAGTQQVLMDVGADRGVSLVLDNNILSAGVNGDAVNTTGFSTGPLSAGWHHAIVVVGDTDPDDWSDDEFTLYVDNAVVGSSRSVDIDDFSGSNSWGFGGVGQATKDPTDGTNQNLTTPANYHGEIAIARYYQNAFDVNEVNQNFLALQDSSQVVGPATLVVDGDFVQGTSATLELDVYELLGNDFLDIAGDFTADGDLIVSLVGGDPAAGTVYDLIDAEVFLGNFDSVTLPTLGGGLTWDDSSLLVDGTLTVLGSFADADEDGDVDGADFLLLQRTNPGLIPDWQSQYGSGSPLKASSASTAVPEPCSSLLLSVGILATCCRRNK